MIPASGPPPRYEYGRPLTLVALAAVALAAGAGGAVIATSGSSSPATAASASGQASASARPPYARGSAPQAPGGRGGFSGGGFSGGGIGGGSSGAPVHGTLVVPDSGGYQTEDIQRGKVTAISSSSVTVVSTDKYTKTYQVNGSTSVNAGNGSLSAVKVGDQVSITATVHGSTATISSIIDLSRLGNGAFGPGGGSQGQPSG